MSKLIYVIVIGEGFDDRKQEVHVAESRMDAQAWVDRYVRRVNKTRDEYDIVDASLYRVNKGGSCVLVDEFSDEALDDGYAAGWKSEGRREEQHQRWMVKHGITTDLH